MEKQTPLMRAVSDYVAQDMARFHMPGHKGSPHGVIGDIDPFKRVYAYDITEVQGADSLYEANGAIARTEEAFTWLYGTQRSLLSAGGSTLCIQAMLALAAEAAPSRKKIIAGRCLHTSAVNAMALLDLEPLWVYPEGGAGLGMGGRVTPQAVAEALSEESDVCAVYITSPDYFGVMSDIAGIAAVCRQYQVPLLVDNAHGAHLRFLSPNRHPIGQGASMCCDSLHKTLPVLTGGALLHIGDPKFVGSAKRRMALFGSTSPSYLVMLSCDHCLLLLDSNYQEKLSNVVQRASDLEELAKSKGFVLLEGERDHTKIVLSVYNWGTDADTFGKRLRASGIEPEYIGPNWAVLMAGTENTGGDYRRVEKFLQSWDGVPQMPEQAPAWMMAPTARPQAVQPLRAAVLAPARRMSVSKAVGQVAASMVCPCPPGIPVVMPGEEITADTANLLKTCGIHLVDVI